jgi:hypothetical protein
MKRKRTIIDFTPGQLKRLADAKRKTGVPVMEIVRRAVDAYLKTEQAK